MKLKTLLSIIILIYTASVAVIPQPVKLFFKPVIAANNLPGEEIRDIHKDHLGFIWIATNNGIIRFDGMSMQVYRENQKDSSSLSSNNVQKIVEYADQSLWFATEKGLCKYEFETDNFKTYRNYSIDPGSISDDNLKTIISIPGFIIIATKNGLDLFDIKTSRVQHCLYPKTVTGISVNSMVADRQNKVWIIDRQEGLYRFDPTSQKYSKYLTQNIGYEFISLYIDTNNALWIGYNNKGFEIFDIEKEELSLSTNKLPASLNNISVNSFIEFDKDWILLAGSGFYLFNPKTKQVDNIEFIDNTEISKITCLLKDKSGILWAGTNNSGLLSHDEGLYRFQDQIPAINQHEIKSNRSFITALYDSYGFLWIGTKYGLNKLVDGEILKTYVYNPSDGASIQTGEIVALNQDRKGMIWVSTKGGGLSKLDPENDNFTKYEYNPLLNTDASQPGDNNYLQIFVDSKGLIWFPSANGIIDCYNPDNTLFSHFKISSDLTAAYSEEDMIWCTGNSKLYSLNKTSKEINEYNLLLSKENSAENIEIRSLTRLPNGLFLMATDKGLLRYNQTNGETVLINKLSGNKLSDLYQIEKDESGMLWFSSENGLYRYNSDNNQLLHFNEIDGILSEAIYFSKVKNNVFIIGGKDGALVFDPQKVKINEQAPPVVITGFRLDNSPVLIKAGSPLQKSIIVADKIELSFRHKMFSFDFAALSYTLPQKNQFAYKLEGWKDDWIYTGNNRSVTFTNIHPGKYVFRVKASNNDGVWNEEGKSIVVIIKKPFWDTIVFYFLIILVISALAYFLYFRYEKKLSREKSVMQEKVDKAVQEVEQKTKEIEDQNKALLEKQAEDERRNWIAEGMNEFTDMLRENTSDLETFSISIISKIAAFIGANLGALYARNDTDENNIIYEIEGSVAYGHKKVINQSYHLTEGLIGSCAFEKKTIYFNDIPKDYVKIASGLGQAPPRSLLIVPCIFNETVFGVIELASLEPIDRYKITFVEELGEKIASTISIVMNNERTVKLLEQSKEQANMLITNEEELRQNLEEMRATQEQSEKREMELLEENEDLRKENSELKAKIRTLSSK